MEKTNEGEMARRLSGPEKWEDEEQETGSDDVLGFSDGGRKQCRFFFQTRQDVLFHFMGRKSAARGSLSSVMAAFSSVSGRGIPSSPPPELV